MKKRHILIIAILVLLVALIILSLGKEQTINTKEFTAEVELNQDIDYGDIVIHSSSFFGSEEIVVTKDMIVSMDDTSSVGEKKMIIRYKNEEYTVTFYVKYRVEFIVDNEVISSQFFMDQKDFVVPENPTKAGHEFIGWTPEIPAEITSNMVFEAQFTDVPLEVPSLGSYEATYGDTLESISLPYNSLGRWVFVDPLSTEVGDAGSNKFKVKFMPTNTELRVIEDEVTINVAKKELFFRVVDTFVYEPGQSYRPTYEVYEKVNGDGELIFDKTTITIKETVIPLTEVGSSIYSFRIEDKNYFGSASGTFEVINPDTEITIQLYEENPGDYTIDLGDKIPEFKYRVLGDISEEKIAQLGIKVVTPNVMSAGNYPISIEVTNTELAKLFIITIDKRDYSITDEEVDICLKVNKIYLNPIDPEYTTGVYGDELSTIIFDNINPNGYWTWKDGSQIISTPESFTAVAVFTPNETSSYFVEERPLTIRVNKKELIINPSEFTFTYNNTERKVIYTISDSEGNNVDFAGVNYNDLVVDGFVTGTNVGEYYQALTIVDDRYFGTKEVTMKINQATPETDFSETLTVPWSKNLTLESVSLPQGYSWVNSDEKLEDIKANYSFAAIFTPEDTHNYCNVEGSFTVNVIKADTSISLATNSIIAEFGDVIDLGVKPGNDEGVLTYTYKFTNFNNEVKEVKDPQTTIDLVSAGTYEITVSMAGTTHYNAAKDVEITVVIKQTSVDKPGLMEATYGDTLDMLTDQFPIETVGSWEWVNDQLTVGDATTDTNNIRYAKFTSTNPDYQSLENVAVYIKVSKKLLTIELNKDKTTYDEINKVYIQSHTFDKTEKTIDFTVLKDGNEITRINVQGNRIESNAGTYNITLVVNEPNYYGSFDGRINLVINPATPETDFSKEFVVDWNKDLILGDIKLPENYRWENSNTKLLECKTNSYTAIYDLQDPNYKTVKGEFSVTVNKIASTITADPTYTYTYSGDVFTLNHIKASHEEQATISYAYEYKTFAGVSKDATEINNAGIYKVTITLAESAHYLSSFTTTEVTVNQISVKNPNVMTATYDDTLAMLTSQFPTEAVGTWAWVDDQLTVGDATTDVNNIRLANFTSTDDNYKSLDNVEVQIKVSKKKVTLDLTTSGYIYSGSNITLEYKVLDGESDITKDVEVVIDGSDIKNAGSYTLDRIYVNDKNYTGEVVLPTIIVAKQEVVKPQEITTSFTYDGKAQEYGLVSTELYTVSGATQTNAGTHKVKIELVDSNNYKWQGLSGDDESASFTYDFVIGQKSVEVKWEYASSYTYNGEVFTTPKATYQNVNDETVELTPLCDKNEFKNAGTYKFTVVTDDNNYLLSNIKLEITVNKATTHVSNSIPETLVYTGTAISNYASWFTSLDSDGKLTVSLVGATEMKNAGEYTLSVSVAETDNYEAFSQDYTVTIAKATVTKPAKPAEKYTYNGYEYTFFTTSSLYYSYSNNTGKDAKDYEVTISLNDPNNYMWADTSSSEAYSETITIHKKDVTPPTIKAKEYTGSLLKASVSDTNEYTVTENNGGIEKGTYDVKLTLNDPTNYKWSTYEGATITLKFAIADTINSWTNEPELVNDSIVYGSNLEFNEYVAGHGSVVIEYRKSSEDADAYKAGDPSTFDAGTYVVRFSVKATDSYSSLVKEIPFTITKKQIEKPAAVDTVFTYIKDTEQTYNIATNAGIYTVSGNKATNAGTHKVLVSLDDKTNYEWIDGTTTDLEYSFVINQASYAVDLPTPTATYGDKVSSVTLESEGGTWAWKGITYSTLVGNVGNNSFTATFTPNDINYKVEDHTIEIAVTQATTVISDFDINRSWDYLASASGASATTNFGEVIFTYEGVDCTYPASTTLPTEAGTYKVVASVTGNANYTSATAEAITFTINKINPTYTKPTGLQVVWGEKLSTVTLPSNLTWNDGTEVISGDVETRSFKATYTPDDTRNYNTLAEEEISVEIIKAKGVIDSNKEELEAENYTHTGSAVAALEATANHEESTLDIVYKHRYIGDSEYSVLDSKTICESGDYLITITLPESDHYEEEVVTISFTVKQDEIEVSNTAFEGYFDTTSSDVVEMMLEQEKENVVIDNYEVSISLTDPNLSARRRAASKSTGIGSVGESIYAWLIFTPTNKNYVKIIEKIVISIVQKPVDIQIEKTTFEYIAGTTQYLTFKVLDGQNVLDGITVNGNTGWTNAGTYNITLEVEDENYVCSKAVTVVIEKQKVNAPSADTTNYYYTGNSITYQLATDSRYTISNNTTQVNASTYNVIVSLNDVANYIWSDGDVAEYKEYQFVINQADNTITKLTLPGWAYNEFDASVNKASAKSTFGKISYTYTDVNGNPISVSNALEVGTYTVTATVSETTNYKGCEESTEFTVSKGTYNMSNAKWSTSSFTYDATEKEVIITGLPTGVTATYENNKYTNAGNYTAKAIFKYDTKNYNEPTIADCTWSIAKATISVVWDILDSYTYGDGFSTPTASLTVKGSATPITLTVTEKDGKTFKNAGSYTFVAAISDEILANHIVNSTETSITVNKKVVTPPTIDPQEYNGSTIVPSVSDTDEYTVTENNGGLDKGTYDVKLTLKDSDNYEWSTDKVNATITLKFEITATINDWTVEPSLTEDSIVYGSALEFNEYDAKFGDVVVEYRKSTESADAYKAGNPSTFNVGTYVVRFSVAGTLDYSSLSKEITFTITKKQIAKPEEIDTVFTYIKDTEQTYNIATNEGIYTVSGNKATNAGTHKVFVSLDDKTNYEWNDGTTTDLEYSFVINQASYAVDLPTPTATYGDKVSSVTLESEGGTWAWKGITDSTLVGNVGNNSFTATFTPNDINYKVEDHTIVIAVTQATTVISDFDIKRSWNYLEAATGASATTNFGEVIFTYTGVDYSSTTLPTEAGTYKVVASVTGNANYTSATAEAITFTINKINPTYTKPTGLQVVWGEKLSTVTLPDNLTWNNGAEVISGNIGTRDFLATYTPSDTRNYNTLEAEAISVTVIKATGIITSNKEALETGTCAYTGDIILTLMTFANHEESALDIVYKHKYAEADEFSVLDSKEIIESGYYKITITLPESEHYTGDSVEINIFVDKKTETIDPNAQAEIGDTLSSVPVPQSLGGSWALEAETAVYARSGLTDLVFDALGNVTVNAIFTSTSKNYHDVVRIVVINVEPRTLAINLTSPVKFEYNGEAHKLAFNILDKDGSLFAKSEILTISGNTGWKDAGTYDYTLSISSEGDLYRGEIQGQVVITPQVVNVPEADSKTYYYTGNPITYQLASDSRYTISDNTTQTNADKYTISVTLNDKHNYIWSNKSTSDIEYQFVINQADNEITDLTLPGWAYNEFNASVNKVSAKSTFGDITYKYTDAVGQEISLSNALEVGTYTVTATVTETTNYKGSEETITFNVIKGTYNMKNAKWTTSSFTYDATIKEVTITGLPEGVTATYTDNKFTNAGNYIAKATLAYDTKNYNEPKMADYSWSIAKATISVVWDVLASYTYGAGFSTPTASLTVEGSSTPTSLTVTEKDGKTFKNAGSYTFVAAISDEILVNHIVNSTETSITVNKKTVTPPTIDSEEYTGSTIVPVVNNTDEYTVTENNGGLDKGTYDVKLTLKDSDNYEWSTDKVNATITLKFEITATANSWEVEPALDADSIVYGSALEFNEYSVKFGTVVVEYRKSTESADAYKAGNPATFNAGTYVVRFSVAETINYNGLSKEITFTITKKQIEKPAAVDTVFTYIKDTEQTYNIATNEGIYTVSGNKATNAGTYEVLVSLDDKTNYEWKDGTTTDLEYSFVINQASYAVDLPTPTATYGDKVSSVTLESEGGTWAWKGITDSTLVGNVGNNSFTATFTPNDINYKVEDHTIVIAVTQATTVISDFDIKRSWDYLASASGASATTNFGEVIFTYEGVDCTYPASTILPTEAGTYKVVASVTGNANYTSATTEAIEFTINKIDPEYTIPTGLQVVWGEKLSTVALPDNFSWNNGSQKVTGAIGSSKFVATYTPADTRNYNTLTSLLIPVTVIKATGVITSNKAELEAGNYIYNGEVLATLEASANHTYSTLEIVYQHKYAEADEFSELTSKTIREAGYYKITITLPASDYYTGAEEVIEFKVSQEQLEVSNTKFDAYFDTTATDVLNMMLEQEKDNKEINNYNASISLTDSNPLGSVGDTVNASIIFTPKDTNHASVVIEIVITIVKKPVDIQIEKTTFVYIADTKQYLTIKVLDGETVLDGITVEGNTGWMNAGTYDITLEVVNENYVGAKEVTVIVEKQKVTVPSADETTYTYTGNEITYQLVADSRYTISDNITQTNAGKYTVTATLINTDNYIWSDNDEAATKEYQFVINQAANEITGLTLPGWKYNTFDENVNKATATSAFGDITYTYTDLNGNLVELSNELKVGTYKVTATVTGTSNYEGCTSTTEFKVEKGTYNMDNATWSGNSFTYDGTIKEVTITGLPEGVTATYTDNKFTNAGNYIAKATLAYDADNYNAPTIDNCSWEITPKEVTLTWDNQESYTYNHLDSGFAIPNAYFTDVNNQVVTLISKETSNKAFREAGSYEFKVTLDDNNYELLNDTITVVVNKSDNVINANDTYSFTYSGNANVLEDMSALEGATISYKYLNTLTNKEVKEMVDAGTYKVTISTTETANHKATTKVVEVVVSPKELAVTWTNAADHEYTSNVFTTPVATITLDGNEMKLSVAEKDNKVFKDADTYTFIASYDDTNYTLTGATITVEVTKRVIQIPTIASKLYNGSLQTATIPASNFYTVKENNGGTDPGKYKVVLSLDANCEWNDGTIGDKELEFAITANKITVTWEYTGSKVYTGSVLPTPTAKAADDSIVINVTCDATEFKNAGTYIFTATSTDKNYEITNNTFEVTIGKIDNIITANSSYSFTYSGNANVLEDVSALESATISYTYKLGNEVVDTMTNAGTYKVIITASATTNYKETSIDVEAVVNPKTVAVNWNYDATYTYTGNELTIPTATIEGVDAALTVTEKNGKTFLNAGTYTFVATANSNYTLTNNELSVTVGKADTTVEQVVSRVEYRGTAFTATDFATWFTANHLDVHFTLSGATEMVNAGTYNIIVSVTSNTNYKDYNTTYEVVVYQKAYTPTVTWPTYSNVTYGDLMSSLALPTATGEQAGTWSWKNATAETTVGNAGDNTYVAVFTPTNTNYTASEHSVTINVAKKTLTIKVTQDSFVYNESAHTVTYKVIDENDKEYSVNVVENDITRTVYGSQTYTLTIDDLNYQGSVTGTLTVAKGTLSDISVPTQTEIEGPYQSKLSDIELPTNGNGTWSFENPNTVIEKTGPYVLIFTPNNENYNTMRFENVYITMVKGTTTLTATNIPTNLVYSSSKAYTEEDILGWITFNRTVNSSDVTFTIKDSSNTPVTSMQNAGTYTIVMVVSETVTHSGFNNSDNPLTVTIAQAEYTSYSALPTIGTATYGNTLEDVSITSTISGETWSWQTPTDLVGNAGTQTHYAIYNTNNSNYKPTVFAISITVNKKAITLTIDNSTFTYNGKAQYITYTVTDGSTVLSNIAVDGNDGWTNAGNYGEVTLTIDDTNYSGSATATVIVNKAKAVTQWPVYGNTYYEDRVNAATDYTTDPKANTTGTWSYGTPTYGGGQTAYTATNNGYASSKAAIAGTFSVTFTPNDTANYEIETNSSVAIKIAPVAYNGGYSYGTIEKALNAANGGDTIWVIVGTNPVIRENVTLKGQTKLVIPYANDTLSSSTATLSGGDDTYGSFSKLSLMNTVTIKSGVTLTVRGTLEIGGELSGGGGGSDAAGHTAGRYSRILMNSASEINVYGMVNAFGYIDESETDNGSKVTVNSGATLWQPFVLRDFRGGSVMYGVYKEISSLHMSPFNSFEMRNITSLVRINHGGSVKTWANLFANSSQNYTSINVIGTANSIINLTDSKYSYVSSKYNRSTEINELDIYGGAYTGVMKLKLNVGFSVNISTDDVYFPLTWRYHVSLNKNTAEGQSANAIYSMTQKFKMMTGHIFRVEAGTELTINEVNVYETFVDNLSNNDEGNPMGHLYPVKDPAQLIVNGQLTATVLGGKVLTESNEGAQLAVSTNTITTYEPSKVTGSSFLASLKAKQTFNNTLALKMTDENTGVASDTATTQSAGIYVSMNGGWVIADGINKYYIIYDENGGNEIKDTTFYSFDFSLTIDETTLPTPIKPYYEFTGWFYTDADGALQSVDGYTMTIPTNSEGSWTTDSEGKVINYTTLNVVAGWDTADLTITYVVNYNECTTAGNYKNTNAQTYSVGNPVTLVPASDSTETKVLVFYGWYLDEGYTIKVPTISTEEMAKYGIENVTLYGYFSEKSSYTVTFVDNSDDFTDVAAIEVPKGNTTNLPDLSTYDNIYTYQKYCVGWYTTSTFTEGTEFTSSTPVTSDVTLYAKWVDKVQVQVDLNGDGTYFDTDVNGDGSTNSSDVYWIIPNTEFGHVLIATEKEGYYFYDWEVIGTSTTYETEISTITIDGSVSTNVVKIKARYSVNITVKNSSWVYVMVTTVTIYDKNGNIYLTENYNLSEGSTKDYVLHPGYKITVSATYNRRTWSGTTVTTAKGVVTSKEYSSPTTIRLSTI